MSRLQELIDAIPKEPPMPRGIVRKRFDWRGYYALRVARRNAIIRAYHEALKDCTAVIPRVWYQAQAAHDLMERFEKEFDDIPRSPK